MKPLITTITCFCIIVLLQSLATNVMGIERTSNIDEFTFENQRTRKKQNYLMHRNKDMLQDNENFGRVYNTEPLDPDANPEELSAFIVDYANMIRNDVILLDNSVETRTRKRGNIKVEEYNNNITDLGENVFPRFIESRKCNTLQQQACLPPYICKESLYNLTILKKRKSITEKSLDLPHELSRKWIAEKHPVSVGCICTRDYVI